ncbi:MAG: hypothetical protein A2934_05150 [Candidatus Sungbacteria bacterium RIFCSPLOWO2_01_FULL_47_10]|uniref:Uncharacterized protein n=1 Tax=Candidatus Sungbacteria bacterium RIFCSPLOWO2_01_FULL_47_10 TaxID=1802276 RepID=A0A1G2KYH1_9BACT|nr:MAG: hypothetical protein A2934_05150 [Candidatus Sungbacteria bacterium RIFCSPLOWO2_01_FULL_47_10]
MKETSLGAVLVIFGFFLGWASMRLSVFTYGDVLERPYELWHLIFAPLFIAFFSLFSILVKTFWVGAAALFFSVVLMYISFPFANIFAWGILLGTLMLFLSYRLIRHDYASSVKTSPVRIVKRNLGMFFTGLAIVFSMVYFAGFREDMDLISYLLPGSIFFKIADTLEGPIAAVLPGFRTSDTIDEFISRNVREQLSHQAQNVPESVIDSVVREQRASYSENFGIPLTGNEKVVNVMYEFVSLRTRKIIGPFKEYIPIIFTFGFFLMLRSVAFVFYYVSLLFFWPVLIILISSGFVKKEKIQVEKEELML